MTFGLVDMRTGADGGQDPASKYRWKLVNLGLMALPHATLVSSHDVGPRQLDPVATGSGHSPPQF